MQHVRLMWEHVFLRFYALLVLSGRKSGSGSLHLDFTVRFCKAQRRCSVSCYISSDTC